MLYHLLYPLHEQFPALNVVRYLSFRTVYAAVTALGLSLLLGNWATGLLRRFQIGQQIREEGPKSHQSKAGTPTMGGVLILGAILLSTLLWANLGNPYIWLVILVTTGFGAIGFWDDMLKSVRKNSQGLLPRYKFGLQILVAAVASFALHALPAYSTLLSIPFFKAYRPDLGLFYALFALVVIVGASNAVNLTDGLDGLAIGPIITSAIAYTLFAYLAGHRKFSEYLLIPHVEGAGELAIFCGAMVGAGLGFLWFNSHPASVFMGDVGSLPLGAALGMVAIVSKQELLLVIVGGVFVVEALSVVAQVASYRSRGKRIFLMSPLHHHFELKGWPETKVVARFWIVSVVLALLSLSTLKLR
jgi:phospho-N-acetylmuramoyl-pentapeptide-transferase